MSEGATNGLGNGDVLRRKMQLLRDHIGEAGWPVVRAFIERRERPTHEGWVDEMLADLTRGQWIEADLVQVCRDDAAMSRPIATPKGLRVFLNSARDERLGVQNGGREHASHPTRKRAVQDGLRSTPTKSAKDLKWT